MNTNLNEISKSAIFICGDFRKTNGIADLRFAQTKQKLQDLKFDSINAAEIDDDAADPAEKAENIKRKRAAALAMCGVLVTVGDWGNNDEAKALITIARLLGKEVFALELLDRYLNITRNHAA